MLQEKIAEVEKSRQNFEISKATLIALKKFNGNERLTPEEKHLLYQIAACWYQLSATEEEQKNKEHPLNQDMKKIPDLSNEYIASVFPYVRRAFFSEDLLWINVSNMLFNLEVAADYLFNEAEILGEEVHGTIQEERKYWRMQFLILYKNIMQGICRHINEHRQPFWVGEYVENIRRHYNAWNKSTLPHGPYMIDLRDCELKRLNLSSGINLSDVDLTGSNVHFAVLNNTGVTAEQIAKTYGFSSAVGLAPELIQVAQQIRYEFELTEVDNTINSCEELLKDIETINYMSAVKPDGNLFVIPWDFRAKVQFFVLASMQINTISHEKHTSAKRIAEIGEKEFLSSEMKETCWQALLGLHRFSIPMQQLVEGQLHYLTEVSHRIERQSLSAITYEDFTAEQKETLEVKYALLALSCQNLRAQHHDVMNEVMHALMILQIDNIHVALEQDDKEKAKIIFSNIFSLARETKTEVDLREVDFPAELYQGISFSKLYLKATESQREKWSLEQRRVHNEGLFIAIENNDEKALREGVEEAGWDVNLHNAAGRTPLMVACYQNKLKLAKYLHEKGANVNARIEREGEKNGNNVLGGIVKQLPYDNDYQPIVDWLLDVGIEVSLENALLLNRVDLFDKKLREVSKSAAYDDGESFRNTMKGLLRESVQNNSVDVFNCIFNYYPNSIHQDRNELPLLHVACGEGHVEMVKTLLGKKNSDINVLDRHERTALIYMAEQFLERRDSEESIRRKAIEHYSDIAALLVQHGAHYHIFTAIIFIKKTREVMKIVHGKIDSPCDRQGNTPSHLAVLTNNLKLMRLLIDQKAKADSLSKSGLTPLQLACEMQLEPMVELLLQGGANPNGAKQALTEEQEKLLTALRETGLSTVDNLLKELPSVGNKETPLHRVAKFNNLNLIKLLSQYHVDLEVKYGGKTPLQLAVQRGYEETVKLLLSLGAKVTTADLDGALPLHTAVRARRVNIIPVLLRGFIEQQDSSGHSSLDLATTQELYQALLPHDDMFSSSSSSDVIVVDDEAQEQLERLPRDPARYSYVQNRAFWGQAESSSSRSAPTFGANANLRPHSP